MPCACRRRNRLLEVFSQLSTSAAPNANTTRVSNYLYDLLGYGYCHTATHGWLYISLIDTSRKPYGENIQDAEIRLFDGNGKLLANAKSDHQYGVVRLIHPGAGDCAAEERSTSSSSTAQDRWQKCFETLSTWLIGWAGQIHFTDVKFAGCDL